MKAKFPVCLCNGKPDRTSAPLFLFKLMIKVFYVWLDVEK